MDFVSRATRLKAQQKEHKLMEIEATLNRLRQDEGFCSAEKKYKKAMFDCARLKALKQDVSVAEKLVKDTETLLLAELNRLGQTKQDIEYIPECELCKDNGSVSGKPCKCLFSLVKQCMHEEGDLPHLISDFDSFNTALYSGEDKTNATKLVSFVKKWTANYPNVTKNYITLTGKTGVGKTYLAGIVANAFLDVGLSVSFFNAFNLNKLFLRAHLAPINEKSAILAEVFNPDLLVIDDLGVEQIFNNVTLESLYLALYERQKKATLITTNLSETMLLSRYDERIFSRLKNGNSSIILPLNGKDLR